MFSNAYQQDCVFPETEVRPLLKSGRLLFVPKDFAHDEYLITLSATVKGEIQGSI